MEAVFEVAADGDSATLSATGSVPVSESGSGTGLVTECAPGKVSDAVREGPKGSEGAELQNSAAPRGAGRRGKRLAASRRRGADGPAGGENGDEDGGEELDDEEEKIDWAVQDPVALRAAAAASGGWSRIIRAPRKRGRHVVLDLCSAGSEVQGSEMKGNELAGAGADGVWGGGRLVKQVVAKADRKGWLGSAGYRLARKCRWGDLWPLSYQDQAINLKH